MAEYLDDELKVDEEEPNGYVPIRSGEEVVLFVPAGKVKDLIKVLQDAAYRSGQLTDREYLHIMKGRLG